MGILRIVSTLLLLFLAVYSVLTALGAFAGITIYFPFHISNADSIPYHRWQSVRVAVLLAFAYFTLLHIFRGTKALYPIKFLEIFIKILTVTGVVLFYRTGMIATHYGIILFFIGCSAILHISARPRLRKYFSRKKPFLLPHIFQTTKYFNPNLDICTLSKPNLLSLNLNNLHSFIHFLVSNGANWMLDYNRS